MSSRSATRRLKALFVASGLFWGMPTGPTSAAVLDLMAPPTEQTVKLEIGEDLWVIASGLESGVALTVVLMDDVGAALHQIDVRTDGEGTLTPTLLWFRTGVVGCDDCRLPEEILSLEFTTFPEAEEALVGRTFSVVLETASQGEEISHHSLPLVEPRATRHFFADVNGCPRYRFGLEEDIYLSVFGGGGSPVRFFVVNERPRWSGSGELFHEIRGLAEGEIVKPSPGSPHRLVKAGTLPVGAYGGILREDPTDTRRLLTDSDILLVHPQDLDRGPTHDDGLVINDWGCCGSSPPE